MAETLYNRDILRLASQLETDPKLSVAGDYYLGQADKASPICGSKISTKAAVDDDGAIIDAIFQISSCAMGQASSALLIEYMHGKTKNDITSMRDALRIKLQGGDAHINEWPKLSILEIAIDYPARHDAILLPYESLILAMNNIVSERMRA